MKKIKKIETKITSCFCPKCDEYLKLTLEGRKLPKKLMIMCAVCDWIYIVHYAE